MTYTRKWWLWRIKLACVLITSFLQLPFAQNREEYKEKQFYTVGIVYHRFGDKRYPSTNTSLENFEKHLSYLQSNGFTSYTTSEYYDLIQAGKAPLGKSVLITIDDAFASFENAVPLLKKYGMKASLFVNTESVGWKDYLTWDQLKAISKEGIEIGNHSHAHSYFVNVPQAERKKFFTQDLLKAEAEFMKHLGWVPKVYVYPYGEFSQDMMDVLKEKSYHLAFAQNSGVFSESSNIYAIPRFPVAGKYVQFNSFKEKVRMKPLKVEDETPPIISSATEVDIKFQLKDKKSKVLNCFVSGEANPPVRSVLGTINQTVQPCKCRRSLVTFTTQDSDGSWQWYSKLIINPDVEE